MHARAESHLCRCFRRQGLQPAAEGFLPSFLQARLMAMAQIAWMVRPLNREILIAAITSARAPSCGVPATVAWMEALLAPMPAIPTARVGPGSLQGKDGCRGMDPGISH